MDCCFNHKNIVRQLHLTPIKNFLKYLLWVVKMKPIYPAVVIFCLHHYEAFLWQCPQKSIWSSHPHTVCFQRKNQIVSNTLKSWVNPEILLTVQAEISDKYRTEGRICDWAFRVTLREFIFVRTHSAQTIPHAEAKGSLQVSKGRVSVIPFRFPVHLICHIFWCFQKR